MWKDVLRFGVLWDMNDNKGTVVLHNADGNRKVLTNIGMQEFSVVSSMLFDARSIQFNSATSQFKAGEEEIDG